ncbi:MAG: RagB/SusD family nutrient uptake outer membrane protein [Mucinivorans sp.]
MKKYFYKSTILVAAIGLSLSSCDSLNLAPEDYPAEGNFWKNEAQVTGSMYGLHTQLRNNYWSFWMLGEARSGTQRTGSGTLGAALNNSDIIGNTLNQNTPGYSNWVGYYRPIMDINLFLEKIEPMGTNIVSKEKKDLYLAQAYSLRAFYYFQLLRTYGGVPIEKKAIVVEGNPDVTVYYTARSTYDQTLAFIKEDLAKADALFAPVGYPSTGQSRELWNKAATKMLIADVYLWGAKFNKTSYNAEELNTALAALNDIPQSKFALMDRYADVFNYANKGNSEIILALNFSTTTAGSNFASQFLYYQNDLTANGCYGKEGQMLDGDTLGLVTTGIQRYEFSFKYFQAYQDQDVRKRTNFLDFYKESAFTTGVLDQSALNRTNTGTVLRKYLGTIDGSTRKYVDDYVVYRYADLLMMRAEIKNALGQDPSEDINALRERAYRTAEGKAQPYPVYVNSDFATNELAIFKEHALETPCEGKMWYDIIRMKQAKGGDPLVFAVSASFLETGLPVLDKATQSHMLVWPIDKNTLTNNPLLVQNPNYAIF